MSLAHLRNHLTLVTTNSHGSSNESEGEEKPKRMRLETEDDVKKSRQNSSISSTVHSKFPVTPITPATQLITPPNSLKPLGKIPTMSLKLQIPQHIADKKEKQQQAARKGAAIRWAKEGKLQRPVPNQKELKAAYDLKLLRHYPANSPASDPSATNLAGTSVPEVNFIKPVIQKSERVTKLLKAFPKLGNLDRTTPNNYAMIHQHGIDQKNLRNNAKILTSEEAVRLAWRNFSAEDPPLQRQCMMESALPGEELMKERLGLENNLPEWMRYKTGKLAQEEQSRKRKRQE